MKLSPMLQRALFVVVMLALLASVEGLSRVVSTMMVLYPWSPILTWPAADLPPVA